MVRHASAALAALSFTLSIPMLAAAQPYPPPTDPATSTPPATDPVAPVEPVAPPPESTEPTAAPPPAPEAQPADSTDMNRPTLLSLGIGVGYSVPASVLDPNLASVRFRLASGLTFEPAMVLRTAKTTTEFGSGESETETTEAEVATLVRLPLAGRGKVDLELVGAAGIGWTRQSPDGPDNDTKTTTMSLSWGVALNWWVKPNWSLSATGLNPLLSFTKTTEEMGGSDLKTTNLAVGAIWSPAIFVMLHMFF